MDDATLIDRLGGPAKLAGTLGYIKGGTQRVFNWKARGRIPPEVKLERQDLFGPDNIRALEQQAAAEGVGNLPPEQLGVAAVQPQHVQG